MEQFFPHHSTHQIYYFSPVATTLLLLFSVNAHSSRVNQISHFLWLIKTVKTHTKKIYSNLKKTKKQQKLSTSGNAEKRFCSHTNIEQIIKLSCSLTKKRQFQKQTKNIHLLIPHFFITDAFNDVKAQVFNVFQKFWMATSQSK